MKPRLKPDHWNFRLACPDDWRAMLACWYGLEHDSDEVAKYYNKLLESPETAANCWLALQYHSLDAVAWLLPHTETMFHCWPLRSRFNLASEQHRKCVVALWNHVYPTLISQGVNHCQTLISTQACEDLETMSLLGFKRVAFIKRMCIAKLQLQPATQKVELVTVDKDNFRTFQACFQSTLIESLDVPELNEELPVERIGRQYRDPALQKFLICNRDPAIVGVAVIECDGATGVLRYMGIAPEHRKRGYGQAAMHLLLNKLKTMHCNAVEVRLDARNIPALRLYESSGFSHLDDEELLLAG